MTLKIEPILHEMAQHGKKNPTHGKDCACKDRMLRDIKDIFRQKPELLEEFLYASSVIQRDSHLRMHVYDRLRREGHHIYYDLLR